MLDLNASDRQMALNEVKVLAKMDHPNIVAYHDSFEKGTNCVHVCIYVHVYTYLCTYLV